MHGQRDQSCIAPRACATPPFTPRLCARRRGPPCWRAAIRIRSANPSRRRSPGANPPPAAEYRTYAVCRRSRSRHSPPDLAPARSRSSLTARLWAATKLGFPGSISWSGPDIGRDRGSPASHYEAPLAFTGRLLRVEVMIDGRSGISVGRSLKLPDFPLSFR